MEMKKEAAVFKEASLQCFIEESSCLEKEEEEVEEAMEAEDVEAESFSSDHKRTQFLTKSHLCYKKPKPSLFSRVHFSRSGWKKSTLKRNLTNLTKSVNL